MRVREHFLLGTETATISVTAKGECTRDALFQHAVRSILAKYQEEFGTEACQQLILDLGANTPEPVQWRLRPEDSCWNQVNEG